MSDYHSKRVQNKWARRSRAHRRLRQHIQGTSERPRLAVYKSLRYVYAQIVDDSNGRTLAQANSSEEALRSGVEKSPSSCAAARAVGEALAERAKARGVERIVFDRGGSIYHGKVRAVAEGARSKGVIF